MGSFTYTAGKELSLAIMVLFNAMSAGMHNSFWTLIGGRLYKEATPQNTTFPYATYHIITVVPDQTIGGKNDAEDFVIQFNIYSNNDTSSLEVENIYTALRALFDWKNLVLTNYYCNYFRWDWARQYQDPDRVWTYAVQYRVALEEGKP
jgi:hypothetical protein